MARQTNGFVGSYSSIAGLTLAFPPSEYGGSYANIVSNGITTKVWSDGVSWNGMTSNQVAALQYALSGAALTATYDGSSRISTTAKSPGRSYTYAYPSSTSETITAADGAVVTFTLDGSGRVIGIVGNFEVVSGSPAPSPAPTPAPSINTALMRYGALLGQSNMENAFQDTSTWPTGNIKAKAYVNSALRRIGTVCDTVADGTVAPYSGQPYTAADALVDGDAIVYFGNKVASVVGDTITLFPGAVGGSRISQWLTGGIYWTSYSSDVAASGVLPKWTIWLQGESDVTGGTAVSTWASNLVSLQGQLVSQAATTASAYGFAVVPIGPCTTAWAAEGGFAPYREAAITHANTATGAWLINATLDASLKSGDSVHYNNASYVRVFKRYAEWLSRWAAGNGTQLAGPKITSASRVGTTITVNIAHSGGTALLDGAGGTGTALAGFRVYDGGTPMTISSTAITSATTVTLTLSATPSGTVTMDFGMANLPFGSTTPSPSVILYDNTTVTNDTVGIPLQPKALFTVS